MKKLLSVLLLCMGTAHAQYIPSQNNKDSTSIGAMANNGMLDLIPKKTNTSAPTYTTYMNIRLISTSWYAFPGGNNSGANNAGVCQQQLNNSGMAAQGWILSGTDYCTEDNGTCTVDGLKCYAVKPM